MMPIMSEVGESSRQADKAPFELKSMGIDSLWLDTSVAERRLLVVFAHPDDESFGWPGIIARYAAAGVTVHYICATRGEAGTVRPEALGEYADLAALRTAELACAARALGLAAVHHLGYRDSGMAGAAENQHSASLFQAPLEQVRNKVAAMIDFVQPQVVITFDPYGGYGHPDHIKIHQATVAAVTAANRTQTASASCKLYFTSMPVMVLRLAILIMRILGRDPRRFGQNRDVDLVQARDQTLPRTTSIEVSAFFEQGERAALCHRSQLGARPPRLLRQLRGRRENLARAIPPWTGGPIESDLFSDV